MTTTRPAEVNNGITTSWIAFTTPGLSAAPECSSQLYRVPGSSNINAFDPEYAQLIPNAVQCLPTEVVQVDLQPTTDLSTRLSLGPFNCPSMFSTAATASVNSISTIVACCPSYRDDNKCISTVSVGQSLVIQSLSGGVVPREDSGITITGVGVTGYVFADDQISSTPITTTITPIIFYPSASAGTATSTPATSTPSTLPSANAVNAQPTQTATPTSTPPPISNNSSGLSVGAKVGITLSVVFAVIAAVVLMAGFHMKRRHHKQLLGTPEEGGITQTRRKPSLIQIARKRATPGSEAPEIHHSMAVTALSPNFLGTGETPGHPGKRLPIDSIIMDPGPHEMEVPPIIELDAGTVDGPTEKELEAAADQREKEIRQTPTPDILRRDQEIPQTPLPAYRETRHQASTSEIIRGDQQNTSRPETPQRSNNNRQQQTPTPETPPPRPSSRQTINTNRGIIRQTSTPDFSTRARRTPTPDTIRRVQFRPQYERDLSETRRGRDVRLDVPGGAISPLSTGERSFLDLSDLED
ncbi:hypothetical protein G7Y89_g8084 [Cudoniella acicularis]|uniref:Uncharacterized protein n=1 Tax=Cudoniella acicularis TaxID=354080 RepID=A0A8H4RHB2_9HELO|nr:hypothetical protein G7Y89_g8084 [Cudoniella acicularis]